MMSDNVQYVRVLIVFGMILTVGGYVDTLPHWYRYQTLCAEVKRSQQDLHALQDFISKQKTRAQPLQKTQLLHPGIESLLDKIEASGLSLREVARIPAVESADQQRDDWRVIVVGQHAQFILFMQLIQAANVYGWLADFTYKSNQAAQSVLSATVQWPSRVLFGAPSFALDNSLSSVSNAPMCINAETLVFPDAQTLLMQVPLTQLRLHGYMYQRGLQQALFALPNGAVATVNQGAEIGREHARVLAINEHGVTVQVRGQMVTLRFNHGGES